jgi:hypothetical protein
VIGHDPQQRVPRRVAERVVDHLEIVAIDIGHQHPLALPPAGEGMP